MWQISGIWEKEKEIRVTFTKKLRAGEIRKMFITILFRVGLPFSSLKELKD
jgi:hypothetical protein